MHNQYIYSLKANLFLQIILAYIYEGISSSQIDLPYLIPINPLDGILSSAGSSLAGNGPEQAVDYTSPNRRRTYWNPQGLPTGYSNYFIVFDFKSLHLVTKLHIINFGDNEHDVTAFKLESSCDGGNWTDVARFFSQPGTRTKQKFGRFVSMNRYWRFTITDTVHGQQPWLVEVGFYGARMGFDIPISVPLNIGHSKDARGRDTSIERSLQRAVYKYAKTRTPAVRTDHKDRGRSLKESTYKYMHNNSKATTIEKPQEDANMDMSLKKSSAMSEHKSPRGTTTEKTLDDVDDLEGESKRNITRVTTTGSPLYDALGDILEDVIHDTPSVITTESAPMTGSTKIVSHMHVSSLDTETDSFEEFFKILGISHGINQGSGKMPNSPREIKRGTKAAKYMSWLYSTLALVLLGLALVIMGCIILQLIKRQNKLLLSAIEFNKGPVTSSDISPMQHRPTEQCNAIVKYRSHTNMHKDQSLPVTPV